MEKNKPINKQSREIINNVKEFMEEAKMGHFLLIPRKF